MFISSVLPQVNAEFTKATGDFLNLLEQPTTPDYDSWNFILCAIRTPKNLNFTKEFFISSSQKKPLRLSQSSSTPPLSAASSPPPNSDTIAPTPNSHHLYHESIEGIFNHVAVRRRTNCLNPRICIWFKLLPRRDGDEQVKAQSSHKYLQSN
ncbi:unnamed protein product [Linum trigynum]|uniref:Uncharacterized protein n=1 Tax=Linum trigynum TaxID=586398 RepID=A0AAV2GJT4_9ROSI